jgi:hypothetical protein
MRMRRSWRVLAGGTLLASAVPFAAVAQDAKETVRVTVAGGKTPGSFEATGTRGGCSYGLSGPGSFGNQLSAPGDKDPKKLNSLQLIVPDAKAAAAGTKTFYLKVGFGPLMNRTAEYEVDTRAEAKPARGSGTVTVQDGGTTGKVTFSATTAEGVKLDGTIDCKSILRSGG